jgi:hypothetical protein
MTSRLLSAMAALVFGITLAFQAAAATPVTENGVTTIHLDQYNGYFAAQETLSGLKAGNYRFVITNKANKVVGWQLQNGQTHEQLDMFPLQPGETGVSEVEITSDGFRYRCPINPTPWYEVGVSG